MSVTRFETSATPEQVWAVLENPDAYRGWVVGSKDIRAAEPGFPRPGTRFHHTVGWGPFQVKDHSQVLTAEPPHRLVLEVKARPLGRARVDMVITTREGGSLITMHETPISPISRLTHNPLLDLLLHGRNQEALQRLDRLARGVDPIPETSRSRSHSAA